MLSNASTSSSATPRLSSTDAFKHYNICQLLTRRSLGFYTKDASVVYRKNMEILRKLICQVSHQLLEVPSVTPEPRIIYQMPPCSKSEKIEDALLLECPVGEVLPCPSDYKPSLAVLTAHNWLFRLSASSGEILEKVYLTSACKFRYLSWDTPQEIMVVKSAQCKVLAAARQAGIQQSVLFFLAVFRVLPLSFIGMLEIDKKIFGNSITDATLSHSMLIVMHSVGLVRLYSFQSISEKFMTKQVDLGHECNWNGKVGVVGKYPFGIPCNIKITDTPDLLFEVSSLENTFQVGGYPWHYIITPNKKSQRGIFHVCSLKDHILAKNGILDMKCCSLEPDWISFHPDSSGRILHVGPNLIKILKLMKTNSVTEQQEIKEDFIIEAHRENDVNNSVTVTASGRVVKKRINLLDDDPEQETFKIVDYEDELDLLSVVAVTQIGSDGAAHLDFHCNEYGTRLKRVLFAEPWDVTFSHEVYFDRNVVLHIEQKPNRIFSCYVYQMACGSSREGEGTRKDKRERHFCKKMGRTFECF
ncbi:DDB1- and CUL4-associated factor 17 isoform X2 [Sphaerodactylus townsendi]|uniref:DDB1- and CUL4-associated factor 17 isoform X2 n=1 Tax=Sphaerodactylus townsendi TaxID=933632 RepID=UPI0020262B5C|nr:DDB1- and CUL4-associated factor 17 isoform X2 [Sphaerodactylus townsendi]